VGPSGEPMTDLGDPLLRHLCNPTVPELLCTSRALLKKMDTRPVVGDSVEVRGIDWVEGRGVVHAIASRATLLREPLVANVDHAIVMLSVKSPPFEPLQATRFIAAAHASALPVTVVLSKCDLATEGEMLAVARSVLAWGYSPLPISVRERVGLGPVLEATEGRTSVVFGPSGVGKSSLINGLRLLHSETDPGTMRGWQGTGVALLDGARPAHLVRGKGEWVSGAGLPAEGEGRGGHPAAAAAAAWEEVEEEEGPAWYEGERVASEAGVTLLRTSAVSRQTGRGRHTTRTATLMDMPGGGLLADTPGFNLPTLTGLPSSAIEDCFPEIAAIHREAGPCAFRDCTHRHEPGCPVASRSWERYSLYLDLLAEVEENERVERERAQSKRQREGKTKTKAQRSSQGGGRDGRTEVRLESKKHRRTNRRTVNQTLDGLTGGRDIDFGDGDDYPR